jgi:hypothetical protein
MEAYRLELALCMLSHDSNQEHPPICKKLRDLERSFRRIAPRL